MASGSDTPPSTHTSNTPAPTPAAGAPATSAAAPDIAAGSMSDQAAGMIALDVEAFANGFMQIMLSGIGWASSEIAKTEGADGSKELQIFTQALSNDLPAIINNINAAAKGTLIDVEAAKGGGMENETIKKSPFSFSSSKS